VPSGARPGDSETDGIAPESVLAIDNVLFDLPVASASTRGLAAFVDYLTIGFVMAVVVTVALFAGHGLGLRSMWWVAGLILALFALNYGFFAGFEIATKGQTPGKRLLGLRVVSRYGSRAGTAAVLVRNAVRDIDVVIGAPLMVLDPLSRRLGDRLAGTLVIRARASATAVVRRVPRSWTPEQIAALESFLQRRSELLPERAERLALSLLAAIERDEPSLLADEVSFPDPIARLEASVNRGAGAMSYTRLVRQRTPVWDEFERLLGQADEAALSHGALESLAMLYRQVLHDYALLRHRFRGTAAAERLLHLALEGTHALRLETDENLVGVAVFFTRSFPRAFRRYVPHLGVMVLLFFSAAVLGFSLTVLRPAVGLGLLGPDAVRGLKEGQLWTEALFSVVPPGLASSAIATNNMAVALTGWAGGALAGLGALHVVLMNGFFLGAIVAATWHYSMADKLLEFVSAHGPLEITLILVTAAAGLGMGEALLAARDRPRRDALVDAARSAVIVLIGCLPWFLVLGFVESFLSPAPTIPPSLKLALGLALEGLFLCLAWNPFLKETR
jgi:uncharacterized membrane protein SpoIIM required for sporulation/uncharacterized RDD family membrane protein YckC